MMGYWWGPQMFGCGGGFVGGLLLLLLGLATVLLLTRKQAEAPTANQPLEMLKTRYAKGEINKKEFEEMKKDLN